MVILILGARQLTAVGVLRLSFPVCRIGEACAISSRLSNTCMVVWFGIPALPALVLGRPVRDCADVDARPGLRHCPSIATTGLDKAFRRGHRKF